MQKRKGKVGDGPHKKRASRLMTHEGGYLYTGIPSFFLFICSFVYQSVQKTVGNVTRPHAFASSAYVQFPTLFHYFPLWLPSKTFSCVTIPYGDIPSSAICYFFLSLTHPLPSTLLLIPLPFWTSFGVLVLEDEGKHCYKL